MQHASSNPRVTRLTPLAEARERLCGGLSPVPPQRRASAESRGLVLAEEVRAPRDLPPGPVAYTDGWAVNAEELVGATPYSAAILAPPPPWVEADDAMPGELDAVLPPEAVTLAAPGMAEASADIAPGEGVRNTGSDIAAGAPLLEAGRRLDAHHLALLAACDVASIAVRVPRVRLVVASAAAERQADLVRLWLADAGAEVVETLRAEGREALATMFRAADVDLVLSLGGTGQGRTDHAVAALADAGAVRVQGVALRPGSGAAFGEVDDVPVLLLPGRLDALVAAFLVLAAPALARLAGRMASPEGHPAAVTDKVASTIGLAEIFLALPDGDGVRPVPLEEAGFAALAAAGGWFLVPPEAEGLPAGGRVQVGPFSPR